MAATATHLMPDVAEDDRRFRILIVDDHEVVHWGFRLKLSRESWVSRCLGARNGEEALQMVSRYSPHVALIDLMLGDEAGADVCQRIRHAAPGTRVLLMSGSGAINRATARGLGASGFVPKGWPTADLLPAIRAVGLGATVFGPPPPKSKLSLTGREQEILDLLASGRTNREIARSIQISPHTVKEHVSSMYRKLGAHTRTSAVHRAQQLGLLT
jgi:DNA-binding NarL/FixJ family response regulator